MWMPIAAHFLNNGIAVVAWYLIYKDKLSPEIENIGTTANSYHWAAISLILILLTMWLIKKENRSHSIILDDVTSE